MLHMINKINTIIAHLLVFCVHLMTHTTFPADASEPVAIDSRIKTFVYSENEIFPIVLNYGYQTAIEFSKDETIQTYSVGNQFVWQFSAIGRTLFIKPLEENIVTNMTVLTNKRRYYFELYSKLTSDAPDEEMSYVVRFFYPDSTNDSIAVQHDMTQQQQLGEISPIKPYNFNYKISGIGAGNLTVVFDNDINTFLKMKGPSHHDSEVICQDSSGMTKTLQVKTVGNYLVVNKICSVLRMNIDNKNIAVQKTDK